MNLKVYTTPSAVLPCSLLTSLYDANPTLVEWAAVHSLITADPGIKQNTLTSKDPRFWTSVANRPQADQANRDKQKHAKKENRNEHPVPHQKEKNAISASPLSQKIIKKTQPIKNQ